MKKCLFSVVSLALLCGLASSQDITQQQASTTITAFKTIACNGYYTSSVLINPTYDNYVYSDDFAIRNPLTFYNMSHGDGYCCISKSTGKIGFYCTEITFGNDTNISNVADQNYPSHSTLSQSTVIALAQQYIADAGWTGTYQAHSVKFYHVNKINQDIYALDMRLVVSGVAVENPIRIEIEPTTGTLMFFNFPEVLTQLPSNLVPSISVTDARATMLSRLSQDLGITSPLEIDVVELQAALPKVEEGNTYCTFTTDDRSLAASNQGKLLYHATFRPGSLVGESVEVLVDALTGDFKTYVFHPYEHVLMGSRQKSYPGMFWNWGQGVTTIMSGKASSQIANADISDVNVVNGPKKGVKMFIQRGRLSVQCEFDPRSKLIWFTRDQVKRYGRPNQALLKALLHLAVAP
jgi:hypothetical protein